MIDSTARVARMSSHTRASLCTLAALFGSALPMARAASAQDAPLYDDLGDHHYGVTTAAPPVQEYFDQGLRLYYAFNHAEAVRSFRAAQEIDPSCAMCYWGEALSYGPNINLPMDSASAVAAYEALTRAQAALDDETDRERGLVEALSVRYVPNPPGDRAALDSAYADAMSKLADRYPDDDEISVLYGESLMDLRPWDYWTADGRPQPGISEALDHLTRVVERSPEHPGACHFYIHAVEKEHPERAVPCAERLASLMPGAGHIVHMPGHIYVRVGRYQDAVEANEHAVHADEEYIRDQRPGVGMYTAGYYPHNYDFMAFAGLMSGQVDKAVEAAERLTSLVPEEMFGAPGMSFLQHWITRPLQIQVRFQRWEEILEEPAPPEDLPHARAVWRYARGRALAAVGRTDEARQELARLRELARTPELEGVRMEFNASHDILAIPTDVLAGRIAQAEGRLDEAVERLRDAVRHEDALLYGEPPEWTVPVRQELGEVLLDAGRAEDAARAFREDLERFPDNGWSLHGLARALRAQGRDADAREVERRFEEAWSASDAPL
ncbi:MAG: tetratricopeptide repeat protein [Gemmatimonadota bacterium]